MTNKVDPVEILSAEKENVYVAVVGGVYVVEQVI